MNPTTKQWTIASSLFALGLAGSLALAEEGWPGKGPGAGAPEGGPAKGKGPRGARMERGGDFGGPGGPQHGMPGGFGGAYEMLGRPQVRERLGITDDQWKAIEADRDQRKEAAKASRENLQNLEKELRDLLTGEADPDLGAVNELAGRIDILRAELHGQMLAHAVFVRQTLTPEQEAKVREAREKVGEAREKIAERREEFVERRREQFAEGRGGREGRRPGGRPGFQGDDDGFDRPRGPRPGGPGMDDDMGEGPGDFDGPRQRGPRGGGDFGPDGPRGPRGPQGPGADPEMIAGRLQEQLANATPEEAAAIRERVQRRLDAALERIERQQQMIDEIMQALGDDAPATSPQE